MRLWLRSGALASLLCCASLASGADIVEVKAIEGTNLWVSPSGAVDWIPAAAQLKALKSGDRLRTGERTRITLQMSGTGVLRIPEHTEVEIRLPPKPGPSLLLGLKRGILYFFHRGPPGDIEVHSRTVLAAVRGTEFVAGAPETGGLILTVLEGEVELRDEAGGIRLFSGESAHAGAGRPLIKSSVLDAVRVVQWCLYYPGILSLDELALPPESGQALAAVLNAYQQGDLLAALASYPADRQPASEEEKLLLASLLLTVGQVDEAARLLEALSGEIGQAGTKSQVLKLTRAHQHLIATVQGRLRDITDPPQLAAEWLAASYAFQSKFELQKALDAAREATERSPRFGFAWSRLAELEFSFGRVGEAFRSAQQALRLSPRNAEAVSLNGFLLTAQNDVRAAAESFEQARQLDGRLGNAWLGLALCQMRQGKTSEALDNLELAAAVEPRRALLRSYLGKGYAQAGRLTVADNELELAKQIDPNDPTPWLYSALLWQEKNRPARAVADLTRSQELNDNRQLFRSRLLLDQDRAVRGAHLAVIYQQAGLTNAALVEAVKALRSDYANASAHLFLAESFDALRDPARFNLRYETAWFNQLLLSQLLGPVGVGSLSQNVSAQEYSRLFEADGFHASTTTSWRSDRELREFATVWGRERGTAFSLDLDYQRNAGVRPNNDLDRIEWFSRVQQQLTPDDSIFLLAKYQDYHSGDNYQYWDPETEDRPGFSFDELQDPIVVAAYHRQWGPGHHTLFLGGRLINEQRIRDRGVGIPLVADNDGDGELDVLFRPPFNLTYQSKFEAYTFESQHLVQLQRQLFLAGGRFQTGRFETEDQLFDPQPLVPGISSYTNKSIDDFQRLSLYSYYTLNPLETLSVTAGLNYDQSRYPRNFRHSPVSQGEAERDQFNPKAALVWTPLPNLSLRGAYTRSLGGVSFDESFRLEPAQLAGFIQSFRTIIAESVAGSVSAPAHETFALALDGKTRGGHAHWGLQAEVLNAEVRRDVGLFEFGTLTGLIEPSAAREKLDYRELHLSARFDQFVTDEWTAGVQYHFTRAELDRSVPSLPASLGSPLDRWQTSDLHEIRLHALVNLPSRFFGGMKASWFWQENAYVQGMRKRTERSDDFPAVDLFAGYRFARQHGDWTFGILNLIGNDYHLDPLTPHAELARERVFFTRFRFRL